MYIERKTTTNAIIKAITLARFIAILDKDKLVIKKIKIKK